MCALPTPIGAHAQSCATPKLTGAHAQVSPQMGMAKLGRLGQRLEILRLLVEQRSESHTCMRMHTRRFSVASFVTYCKQHDHQSVLRAMSTHNARLSVTCIFSFMFSQRCLGRTSTLNSTSRNFVMPRHRGLRFSPEHHARVENSILC